MARKVRRFGGPRAYPVIPLSGILRGGGKGFETVRDPNFNYEKKLWRQGFKCIIGVDEVGRGSWVGPVVAGAVAYTPKSKDSLIEIEKLGINDSKALKSQKRCALAAKIRECSMGWGIGEVGVGIINRVGIGKATKMAMRKAILELLRRFHLLGDGTSARNNFLLVDGFHIKYLRGLGLKNQKAIIKGDQKSISIAAASILAKVYRDDLMRKLAKKYKVYGFGRNKGYGTREHQQAILKYGITRVHRRAFVGTFLAKTKFSGGRKTRSL